MPSKGHRLHSRFENVIGHKGWLHCAQNISGLSRLSGSSMSNQQVLASLYGGLVALISVLENYAANRKRGCRWRLLVHRDYVPIRSTN